MCGVAYVWRTIEATVLLLECKGGGGIRRQDCVQNKIHGEYILPVDL